MKSALAIGAVASAASAVVVDGFLVKLALVLVARARKAAPYTFNSELAHEAVSVCLAAEREARELERLARESP